MRAWWRQEPIDDYEPAYEGGRYQGPSRDLTQPLAGVVTTHHDLMMLDFYSDRDAWLSARESEALGYATEEAEYKRDHPMPQLKLYMQRQMDYSRQVKAMRLQKGDK